MQKINILIVEDELITAEEIRSRCISLGYDVAGIASTGKDALKKAKELAPDLILMDIKLRGEMDGIVTARQIKLLHNIPVIFLTAHADPKTVQRAKVTEPYGFILKPFENSELQGVIETALYKFKMETKLRESEDRFRNAFEYAVIGRAMANPEGAFIKVNKTFCEMLGYSEDEMLQRTWMDITHHDDLKESRVMVRQLLQGEIPSFNYIHRLLRMDGGTVWIDLNIVLIRDTNNAPLYMIGNVVDITQRKMTEKRDSLNNAHIRLVNELNANLNANAGLDDLIKKACDGLKAIHRLNFADLLLLQTPHDAPPYLEYKYSNLDHRLSSAVEKLTKIKIKNFKIPLFPGGIFDTFLKNRTPAEYVGKEQVTDAIRDMVPPEKTVLRKLASRVARIAASDYVYMVPLIMRGEPIGQIGLNKDVPFEEDEKAAINLVVGQLASILERKTVEEALRESEEKFRELFNNADDAIYLWRLDRDGKPGKCIEVNDVACRMLGYTRDELLQMTPMHINAEESKKKIPGIIKKLKKQKHITFEMAHKTKNGDRIPVEISSHLFTLRNDKVILSISRDITHHKDVEQRIQKDLKEKEILLKEIHHRVKNNLQVISSLLNLQSSYIQDEQLLDIFRESQNRIRSMALVHEELYSTKDLSGIQFKQYVDRLVSYITRSYIDFSNKIQLSTDIEKVNLPIGMAVPIGLIINELLTNALKHAFPPSFQGKPKIDLSLVKNRKHEYILTVSDNGIGLPGNFDLRKTQSLGMRLVHMLAEDQLEGRITLGKQTGTTFQIRLKLTE